MTRAQPDLTEPNMATRRQIAANRKNAKNSGGPKTVAGKAVSSRNAVKYGLLCRNLFRFPWEDAETFQLIHASLLDELQPQGVREHLLVEQIFSLIWRLRRAPDADAGVTVYRIRDVKGLGPKPYAKIIPTMHLPDDNANETAGEGDPGSDEPSVEKPHWVEAPPPRPNIADIGQAHILDVQEGDVLSKIRRHETSLENSLMRATRELERLQERRFASSKASDLSAPEDTKDSGSRGKAA